MRSKSMAVAVVVLAVGATPAVAMKQTNALRKVSRPAPAAVLPAAAPPVTLSASAPLVVSSSATVKPAVWLPPTPKAGIKWSAKKAVWIR